MLKLDEAVEVDLEVEVKKQGVSIQCLSLARGERCAVARATQKTTRNKVGVSNNWTYFERDRERERVRERERKKERKEKRLK